MEALIRLNNISKSYNNKKVLTNINLTINKGEKIALLGANGQGKTTLIEIITQIQLPTSGTIDYFFDNKQFKQEIGLQFQENNWPANLTINDILSFYKKIYSKIQTERIQYLIKNLDLSSLLKYKAQKLSPGQKQRLNLLLALIHNPKLLILDELTSSLDLHLQKNIIAYINEIVKNQEQTLLLVSHNLLEIETLCSRIIVIKDEKIIFDDKKTNILKQYNNLNSFIEDII
ncbi:ABC transporter ATP-binding protein NatA [Spiroplasma sp. JKS002669]|uniref:ABC transporter ATP-binding protein n=1 Tax=Spiroplasma attinicola TaxID=2904537 RepID=UPI002022D28C|nr:MULTISPECIES: ABC transporter ATP-binding protein [unclassified Spiroplasma]MCL6428732.1 ABC transporter ATP-binding protein NatA [Spiroplasma sp. JKS002669]MCL8211063.1 ABC transporter ATP-binding protein NatA [Spiroplasma sp. JKS002671]